MSRRSPTPPVTSGDVAARLALATPDQLTAVLIGAELKPQQADDAAALATQLTRALWRRAHSPAGLILRPVSLDQLVDRVTQRLGLSPGRGDAWQRLDRLTAHVLPHGRLQQLHHIDPAHRDRLRKKLWPAWTGVAAGGSAAASRLAALKLLGWTRGPIWDLLPVVPKVGPALIGLRAGAATVARLSAPVGIALALFSLNQTLGAEDDRALPLLLGIGLLARELPLVVDVAVVPTASSPRDPVPDTQDPTH